MVQPVTIVGRAPTPGLASIDRPELGSMAIRLPNVFVKGRPLAFDFFLSYEYHEHFLTPSDSWSFTLSGDQLSDIDLIALVPGTSVQVTIDEVVQSIGIMDRIRTRSDRGGGTVVTIEGRDWLSPAVDSHVDPNVRLKASMTLDQAIQAVLGPFGMTVMAIDNLANRNAITGRIYGTPTSKKGKPLKSYILHEIKPYPNEGAFAFCSRVAQRFGLWLWPAQDGQTVILGKPDFDQEPRYQLKHKVGDPAKNNVLDADVDVSGCDQPSCILAYGFGGGGEFARTTLRSAIVNPIVASDISAIISKYPQIKFVTPPIAFSALSPVTEPNARPMYIYDSESHTQAELDAFVLRELSLLMRKSLTANYTIMGHRLNGQPLAVDTIIDVDDDRSVGLGSPGLHMPLWIMGRSFSKRLGQGTTTTIECVRPGSFQP